MDYFKLLLIDQFKHANTLPSRKKETNTFVSNGKIKQHIIGGRPTAVIPIVFPNEEELIEGASIIII